jgi:hypothetical protein
VLYNGHENIAQFLFPGHTKIQEVNFVKFSFYFFLWHREVVDDISELNNNFLT